MYSKIYFLLKMLFVVYLLIKLNRNVVFKNYFPPINNEECSIQFGIPSNEPDTAYWIYQLKMANRTDQTRVGIKIIDMKASQITGNLNKIQYI